MLKYYLAIIGIMNLILVSNLSANDIEKCPVKLSQDTTVRNGVISITVTNPPKVATGIIQLNGAKQYISDPIDLKNGTLKFKVPDDCSIIPLGQYLVTVKLGNMLFSACDSLRIVPALHWEPKLTSIEPSATSEMDTVKVSDENNPGHQSELKTVHLTLRGSGFIVKPSEDNQILFNGRSKKINWIDSTNASKMTPSGIYGHVISPEVIELYQVPVTSDGSLLIAVKQGDTTTGQQKFIAYRWTKVPVGIASGIIALVLSLLVLLLIHAFISSQPYRNDCNVLKVLFLDPETCTYSLSKLQFYLWTAAAIFGYSYLTISKMFVQGLAWPEIPGGLPGIISIGAGTSVGSQVITNLRGPKGAGSENPSLGDFVTTGGVAAADRIQMLVWTILGVGIFCVSVLKHDPGFIKDLDPVPDSMLAIMGISAMGYLGGKFARKPGPVINEISITPALSDSSLGSSAVPPPVAPPNLSQPAAEAQAVFRTFVSVPTGATASVNALSTAITKASQVKTNAEAAALLPKLVELQNQAESAAITAANASAQAVENSDEVLAAEISQQAAAALQDLSSTISSLVCVSMAPPPPGSESSKFTRCIELRGRNLSAEALFEIDGVSLTFTMLAKKTDGVGQPEIVMRDQDNPSLARVLRLSIDPCQLESADFQTYKGWFGAPSVSKKTFTIINPEGQKADISFAVE